MQTPAFTGLPDPQPNGSGMDVDNPRQSEDPESALKSFQPPVDGVVKDLIAEAIIYICLLVIVANIDAGNLTDVSWNNAAEADVRRGSLRSRPP